MCCGVLQCLAKYCSVVCCSVLQCVQYVAVCCSMLQYVAVCHSVVAVWCIVAVCHSVSRYVAVCCSKLQRVATYCCLRMFTYSSGEKQRGNARWVVSHVLVLMRRAVCGYGKGRREKGRRRPFW